MRDRRRAFQCSSWLREPDKQASLAGDGPRNGPRLNVRDLVSAGFSDTHLAMVRFRGEFGPNACDPRSMHCSGLMKANYYNNVTVRSVRAR
jgi:hypothetical protein